MRRIVIQFFMCSVLSLVLSAGRLHAQTSAVSVNAGDLLCLGTIGVGFEHSFSRHYTYDIGARFNPWVFNKGDDQKQSSIKHQTYSAGLRYYFWYVYSGMWVGAKAQFQEYSRGGFNDRLTPEEGDAFGIGIEAGYAWMLSDRFNLNLGLGGWGGVTKYKRFDCPHCGRITDKGTRMFFWPNELIVSFVYVF